MSARFFYAGKRRPRPIWGLPGPFFAWAGKIQKTSKFCLFSLVGPCCYPPEVGLLVFLAYALPGRVLKVYFGFLDVEHSNLVTCMKWDEIAFCTQRPNPDGGYHGWVAGLGVLEKGSLGCGLSKPIMGFQSP